MTITTQPAERRTEYLVFPESSRITIFYPEVSRLSCFVNPSKYRFVSPTLEGSLRNCLASTRGPDIPLINFLLTHRLGRHSDDSSGAGLVRAIHSQPVSHLVGMVVQRIHFAFARELLLFGLPRNTYIYCALSVDLPIRHCTDILCSNEWF